MLTLSKDARAYIVLLSLIICGLAASLVTGVKVVHLGVDFPFSNITFSVFTYPLIDCICELWGKKLAQRTVFIGILAQLMVMLLIHISIIFPEASYWTMSDAYREVLSSSFYIISASALAFIFSQLLDVVLYQKIKIAMNGKWLWLRTNISTFIGQAIDSTIFVLLVFHSSNHKLTILTGSITVKIIISVLMTPIVYAIVITIHRYLGSRTLAFTGLSKKLVPSTNSHTVWQARF